MSEVYDVFSHYYRELIHETRHIEDEIETVKLIISDLNINKQHSILDAACGSGDMLFFLKNYGYNNISGLDASIGMINKAKEILPYVQLFHTSWEKINNQILDKYDYIFTISISLMHASQKDFPLILKNMYQTLNNSGVFIFDNRFWSIEQGEIVQKNRSICEYIDEALLNIDGENIIIDNICRYSEDRQYIKYRIRHKDNVEYIEVSYSRTISETLIKMLYETGFSKVERKCFKIWPYEVLYAFK